MPRLRGQGIGLVSPQCREHAEADHARRRNTQSASRIEASPAGEANRPEADRQTALSARPIQSRGDTATCTDSGVLRRQMPRPERSISASVHGHVRYCCFARGTWKGTRHPEGHPDRGNIRFQTVRLCSSEKVCDERSIRYVSKDRSAACRHFETHECSEQGSISHRIADMCLDRRWRQRRGRQAGPAKAQFGRCVSLGYLLADDARRMLANTNEVMALPLLPNIPSLRGDLCSASVPRNIPFC